MRIYQAMVAALQDQMNTNEQQARETLASFAITEQTLYAEIVRKLRELAEAESPVLDSAMSDDHLSNKHWGVIMTDGDDRSYLQSFSPG